MQLVNRLFGGIIAQWQAQLLRLLASKRTLGIILEFMLTTEASEVTPVYRQEPSEQQVMLDYVVLWIVAVNESCSSVYCTQFGWEKKYFLSLEIYFLE